MKIAFALVLLGLVSTTLAFHNVKKIQPFTIDTSFLKTAHSVKKPSFAQLTATMKQFRDMSQVNAFLDQFSQNLAQERADQLAIIQQTRQQCSDEETFRNEAIAEGERGATAAQNQLTLCSNQRDTAGHLRDLATSAIGIYQNELQDLEAARADAIALYKLRRERLDKVQEGIQQTLRYLDDLEAQGAGLVAAPQFIQVTNKLLKETIKTGHSHLVLPVYSKLIQMHSKQAFNAGAVEEVRALLQQLDENTTNSRQSLDDQEAADEASYNAAHDRLTGLIDRLQNQVSVSNAFIETMNACVAQESSLLDLSNDKVSRNTDLLHQAEQLCDASEEEYRLAEVARTKQQNIINALSSALGQIQQDYEDENAPKVGDLVNLRML